MTHNYLSGHILKFSSDHMKKVLFTEGRRLIYMYNIFSHWRKPNSSDFRIDTEKWSAFGCYCLASIKSCFQNTLSIMCCMTMVEHSTCHSLEPGPLLTKPMDVLPARSRVVSKGRDWVLWWSHLSEIWQAPRQCCCRCACKLQSDWKSINTNLAASSLHEILR